MTMLHTRISGIPCQVQVTFYAPPLPMQWYRDGTCAPPEPEEIEFQVLDRRGRPAPWLTNKMNEADRQAVLAELRQENNDD